MRVYKRLDKQGNEVWVKFNAGGSLQPDIPVPVNPPGGAVKLQMPDGEICLCWPPSEVDAAVKQGGKILGGRYAYEGDGLLADVKEGQPQNYFTLYSDAPR